jgi:hypothetical protein
MNRPTTCWSLLAGLLALAACLAAPARAQTASLDSVTIAVTQEGHGKIGLQITAGPSGAPNGFTVYWMTQEDFDSYGDLWPDSPGSARLGWASYSGAPTLNTDAGAFTTFVLGPNETVEVELGDNRDETGVATDDPYELIYGETWDVSYVFTAFANSGAGFAQSLLARCHPGKTHHPRNCTFTQGYWKNHPTVWPVTSLSLGTVTYSQSQLLAILGTAVKGNGLVSLAHQLIAAKLNLAYGASPLGVTSAIAAADALIGSLVVPPVGAGYLPPVKVCVLTQTLDNFNNGLFGVPSCASTPAIGTTWGAIKTRYR